MSAFFKKEIKEIIKTHKLIIMGVLFIFFAIISPVTARYINEIINAVGGMEFQIPDPVYTDSYMQFFKNIGTLYFIFVIIVSGSIVREKSKGSLMLVLPKGLARKDFILSKTLAYTIFLTALYIISALITILYTYLLFDQAFAPNLLEALIIFWLYGVVLTSMAVFFSTISVSFPMSAGLSFGLYMIFGFMAFFPTIDKFSPSYLNNISTSLIINGNASHITISIIASVVITLVFIISSISVFKHQEL